MCAMYEWIELRILWCAREIAWKKEEQIRFADLAKE